MSDIRQQIKKAQAHIAAEEWAKARAALKDVDHPKAQELRAQVEIHLAEEPIGNFPIIPLIVVFSLVILLALGGLLLFSRSDHEVPASVLPTLAVIPTSDCTSETVQTWWSVQNVALDTFTQDASSASRTMPGERLDERLASLRQFREDFPAPPECANLEVKAGMTDLTLAMDTTISILEDWSTGDSERVTMELPLAQDALRNARTRIQKEF